MPSNIRSTFLGVLAASTLGFGVVAANAAPIFVSTNIDFSSAPATIALGGGAATYTFAYLGYDGSSYTVDSVMTGGTALVNSSGFPGPGQQPIPFELDSLIGNNGYDTFTAFPAAAGIAYSIATDFIGLKFTLADGDHFGFAEVLGPTLVGYAYDDVPNTPIATSDISAAPAPEPASIALLLGGLGLFAAGVVKRRRGTA